MMQRLMSKKRRLSEEDGEVEIELDLGLSLHGRFGVDPLARRSLVRSSSVLDMVVNDRSGLSRTCSLPVETEEEWRKRKELQSLRRLEAKRKITEKQRKQKAAGREEKVVEEGSIGSSGSGSSGLSEVDALPPPPPPPPIQGRRTNKSMETSPSTTLHQPENPGKEASRNIIEDMPCVSTTGDGPNGKKIDGFLYRYRKGEEVKIVCVCHGSFLSPSEFVKHAGGSDVDHPLRHIVVNPSPFL